MGGRVFRLQIENKFPISIMVVVIEDWVLSTVHMWVVKFDKQAARRLIESKITFERVYEAFVKLTEETQCGA